MNTFAAANLFENPVVLVAIAVVWVIASWLKMRRQNSDAANRPDGRLRFFQVLGIKAFGEPLVDGFQQLKRFLAFAL